MPGAPFRFRSILRLEAAVLARMPETQDEDRCLRDLIAQLVIADEDAPDFLSWRANIYSKGRALLMLFLFSDVGERDAPTLIRVGSHADPFFLFLFY